MDARLTLDGEVVLVHDAVAKAGTFRRARVDQSTATQLAALRHTTPVDLYVLLGTDYELSLDLYDPKARVPVLDVAAAAGATDHLWVCAGGLETLVELGERGTGAHLVHSTRRQRITGSVERHAARLAEAGIAAVNMHYRRSKDRRALIARRAHLVRGHPGSAAPRLSLRWGWTLFTLDHVDPHYRDWLLSGSE